MARPSTCWSGEVRLTLKRYFRAVHDLVGYAATAAPHSEENALLNATAS
jgi:hypothetical protein